MTTNEWFDEQFAAITEDLDEEALVTAASPDEYRDLRKHELIRRFRKVRSRLYELSGETGEPELTNPSCDESRRLHIEYHDLLTEMRKRGVAE